MKRGKPNSTSQGPAASASTRLTDEEILERIGTGETVLFELLIRRHGARVSRIIAAILRDPRDVEDATQETMSEAYADLGRFRRASSFSSWLTRIAIHTALRTRRSARRRAVAESSTPSAIAGQTPEDHAVAQEILRRLEEAASRLAPAYLAAFTLREIEHLSTPETARRLGVSEAVVRVRLHRARRRLRGALDVAVTRLAPRLFPFEASRCDRVVATVLSRIRPGASPPQGHLRWGPR